jgi:oligoribonuclease
MTSDFILWLDLETTGNDVFDDIIELGAVLTDQELEEVSSFHRVYRTTRAVSEIDEYVFKMHVDNGLWLDSINATDWAATERSQADILEWLGKAGALKGGAKSLPLAGSGTSHFDRRYIERVWPKLAKRLTYWNLDIGVVRRFFRQWVGPEVWKAYFQLSEEGVDPKNHRALDDVRQHIQEARDFRAYVRGHV